MTLLDAAGVPLPQVEEQLPRLFFSILVAVRNSAAFIDECLDSIMAQTFPSWECLVTDDASDDGTWEKIQAKVGGDPRFRLFRHEERTTALPALMDMIRDAKGDVVALVDGDDYLAHEHALDIVYRIYEDCPSCILTSGSYIRWPDGGIGHCRPVPTGMDWWQSWFFGHLLTWVRKYSLESFEEEPESYCDIQTGKLMTSTYDLPLVFPIVARAEWLDKRVVHNGDINYVYRRHSENDDSTPERLALQSRLALQTALYWQNKMCRVFNAKERA